MPQNYRCLVGINYPPGNKRAGAGSVVGDLSQQSIAALTAPNPVCIEPTNDPVNVIDDMLAAVFSESTDSVPNPQPAPAVAPDPAEAAPSDDLHPATEPAEG